MAIRVRRAEGEPDFRQLHALFVEYETDLPQPLRHGAVPEIAELAQAYDREDAAFLATFEGAAIGCVAVREFDPETAVLLRLFVKPASRGLGAARSLVAAAIAFAKRQGRRRIVLDTHKEELLPAYRLYRSFGFEEREPFAEVAYECPTFMELLLARTLSPPHAHENSRRSDSNR